MKSTVALMIGNDGFAILPQGLKTPFLPLAGDLAFVGMPALTGDLFGSFYISTARACTGPTFAAPLSVVGRLLSTNTASKVVVHDFVALPTLVIPPVNAAWSGMGLAVDYPTVGVPIDLTVYDVVTGNGLMHWTVAVEGGSNNVGLPNLDDLELAGLPDGPVSIAVYGGRIADFDFANLRYANMRTTGMTAYSLDYFAAHK